MGGLGGGGSTQAVATQPATPISSGGYPDDKVSRMPVINSSASSAAARRMQRNIRARSGRASTRLVTDAGTRPFVGSLLGNTQ